MSRSYLGTVIIRVILAFGVATPAFSESAPEAVMPASAGDNFVFDYRNPRIPETPIPFAVGDFAVTPVAGISKSAQKTAAQTEATAKLLTEIVRADLSTLPFLKPVDPASYPKDDLDVGKRPLGAEWTAVGVRVLVVGNVIAREDGNAEIMFRLWDVAKNQQLTGVRYQTTPDNVRQIAHRIADMVQGRITGMGTGRFDSRIVFVSKGADPVERLAVMDADGAQPTMLTSGIMPVSTPRWSPGGEQVAYKAGAPTDPQAKFGPNIYLYNLDTGRQEALSDGDIPKLTPSFTPDGKIIFVQKYEKAGTTVTFLLDLVTRRARQLTDGEELAAYPEPAPDNERFAYVANGKEIRISRFDTKPQTCLDGSTSRFCVIAKDGPFGSLSWAGKGDRIAFTFAGGGRNQIGLVNLDGKVTIIATETDDSEPSFSPDGGAILFTRNAASPSSELWVMDADGGNPRRLPTPEGAAQGDWSEPMR